MPSLLQSLLELLGTVAPGPRLIERFVSPLGNDAADGETDATAYLTISRALADAQQTQANQFVRITLAEGTYAEALDLPSRVTLRALPDAPAQINRPADAPGSVIVIDGKQDVRLEGLKITGGRRDDVVKWGGGVRMTWAVRIELSRCVVSDNESFRGGGIYMLGCRNVTISDCSISENTAGTRESAVKGATVDILLPPHLSYDPGYGHGGGIYVSDSDYVKITGCLVFENKAILFGGGIAVDNPDNAATPAGSVEIVDNDIYCNETMHGDITVIASPVQGCRPFDMPDHLFDELRANSVLLDSQLHTAANNIHGVGRETGMGGGIALRRVASNTIVIANRIGISPLTANGGNAARRGGGISVYTGAYPTISRNEIANNQVTDDGGGVAIDQFDPFMPGATTKFGIAPTKMSRRDRIVLDDNVFRDNRAGSDGGGLYATGGVNLAITSSQGGALFAHNLARENGGGIRVSYATRLSVSGVTIMNNLANMGGGKFGGGGLAARNASVTLDTCVFMRNRSDGRGGAIFFMSSFEGGYSWWGKQEINEHSTFDDLMDTVHAFKVRMLRINNCEGIDNVSSGPAGAGGFLYAVRDPNIGGEQPMWIAIDGASTHLGSNVSDYQNPDAAIGTRKRGNVSIELSGMTWDGTPQDRVYISPNLPLGAIPTSVTSPPAAVQGPPTIVMPDDIAAHDVAALAGYVLGPKPLIYSVTPADAVNTGGSKVHLEGKDFSAGMQVYIGGRAPSAISVLSSTAAVLTMPALEVGMADIDIELASGPQTTMPGAVRIFDQPLVLGITPQSGPPGTQVRLVGAGFIQPLTVEAVGTYWAAPVATVTWESESALTCVMPAAPPEARTVILKVTVLGEYTAPSPVEFAYGPSSL